MQFDDKTKTDEEILTLSIKKPALFEIIVDRYRERFLRTALKVIHDGEFAEDIVQESFVKIYFNAHRFQCDKKGASFKAWAYKIVLHTCFSYYRKIEKQKNSSIQLDRDAYENLGGLSKSDLEKRELRDYVVSILSRMPKSLERALRLYFIEDLPQKKIAEKEGISLSAVKVRIHRAKAEFKKVNLALEKI